MRDTLICTVGTSLKNNILREPASSLYRFLQDGNVKGISLELLNRSPEDRLCGAEINSIHGIIKGKLLGRCENLVLLVSNTEDGDLIGRILMQVYANPRNPERFEKVEFRVIDGLTDQDVKRFRNDGLRNLVRLIGKEARLKGSERLLINATGGYKAQISFAGMIGQALDIPVCYLFERFSEVIQLPPQPVSLDLGFWLDHAELFYDLEEGIVSARSFIHRDEKFHTLVDEADDGGQWIACLSATGQLYHEGFRHKFQHHSETVLPPDSGIAPEMKKIRYEDANQGKHKGLATFMNKLCKRPYVKEIYTHYFNPQLSSSIRFRRSAKGLPGQVEGTFGNAGATTKFDIITTAKDVRQLQACIADLSELAMNGVMSAS
jgi:putative CRISPR-associated protein (TIGR02619 family)